MHHRRPQRLTWASWLTGLLLAFAFSACFSAREHVAAPYRVAPPERLFDIVRVVDGDTIHVERDGKLEKLRLLSVDTEEKILGKPPLSPSKPETIFGEETALWAQEFFDALGADGTARVGLSFPTDIEQRDAFGRLLCHVILPDGRDFNLLLVEEGRSPYFNKYGNSRICHEALVAAQARARAARLGIWNPETNEPQAAGAPAAKRPYERLLPWWQLRAEAVAAFRAKRAADPTRFVASELPEDLRSAFERCEQDPQAEVVVFGAIARTFDEQDGSLTLLFDSGSREESLRVVLPRERDADLERWLRSSMRDFQQNYLYLRGRVTRGPRGYRMQGNERALWWLAGPGGEDFASSSLNR